MPSSSNWSVLEKLFQQGVAFIAFLFVARTLGPEAIGYVATGFIFLALTITIQNGIATSIVLDDSASFSYLTVFFKKILIASILLSLLSIALGYLIYLLKDDSLYIYIFFLLSVFPFVFSLHSIANAYLLKFKMFKELALRTVFSSSISLFSVFYMINSGVGLFSLIYQQFVFYILMAFFGAVSLRTHNIIHKKINFTPSISGSFKNINITALNVLSGEFPKILFFTFFSVVTFGYISVAYRIKHAISEVFVLGPLNYLLPSFSKIKFFENNTSLQEILIGFFDKVYKFLMPIVFFIFCFLFVLFERFMGEKWSSLPLLLLFCSLGVFSYFPYVLFMSISKVTLNSKSLSFTNFLFLIWCFFGCVMVYIFGESILFILYFDFYFIFSSLVLYIFLRKDGKIPLINYYIWVMPLLWFFITSIFYLSYFNGYYYLSCVIFLAVIGFILKEISSRFFIFKKG